jgi:hypothetical protein
MDQETKIEPSDKVPFREIMTDALRYWEPRRLLYNGILAIIVSGYFVALLPASRTVLTFDNALLVFVLAVLANLCYCAAYFADIFAQLSAFRDLWCRWRWALLVIGISFASILTRFFALSFFQGPGGD